MNPIASYNPKKSIKRARNTKKINRNNSIELGKRTYKWDTKLERINIIRKGLPYDSIEFLSYRLNLPVISVLSFLDIPQTTYNKKKREEKLLNSRDSELVLSLTELLDFGLDVFNNEDDKFERWLKKPNSSLGGVEPENLFDSLTGIQEVRNSLNRIEFGNFA